MTAKEFVIEKIHELVTLFPMVRCRYEHHFLSDTHFIEVVPRHVYNLNADYLKWEEEITFLFSSKFTSESLCFISNDALVGINDIHLELRGNKYDVFYNSISQTKIASLHENFGNLQLVHVNVQTDQTSKVLSDLDSISINVFTEIQLSSSTIKYLQFKQCKETNFAGEFSNAIAA